MADAVLALRMTSEARVHVSRTDLADAFDRCSTAVYRYLVVRTGDVHVADDLMQQLWLSAQRTENVPAAELEFWLRGIAKNLLRTHWRKIARRPAHVPIADQSLASALADRLATEALPSADLERREVHDQLMLAITALPAEQQELIIEHYFAQRSQKEIAAALGTSERAIEGRLYRARVALRESLSHLE